MKLFSITFLSSLMSIFVLIKTTSQLYIQEQEINKKNDILVKSIEQLSSSNINDKMNQNLEKLIEKRKHSFLRILHVYI